MSGAFHSGIRSVMNPIPEGTPHRESIQAKAASYGTIVAFLVVSTALLVLGSLGPRVGPLADILSGPAWYKNLVQFGTLLVVGVGAILLWPGRLTPRDIGLDPGKLREAAITIACLYALCQLIPAIIEFALTGSVGIHRSWATQGVPSVLLWAVVMFLFTALYEEVAFRGFLFPQIYLKARGTPRARFWIGLAVSQIIFGLVHIPGHVIIRNMSGATLWVMVGAQAFVGALLVILYLRTRNLWIAIGVHGLINAPTPLVQNPVPWEFYLLVLIVAWPWLARRPEHRGLATVVEGGAPA